MTDLEQLQSRVRRFVEDEIRAISSGPDRPDPYRVVYHATEGAREACRGFIRYPDGWLVPVEDEKSR